MHPRVWLAFGDINGQDFWRNRRRIDHVRFTEPPQAEKEPLRFATECRLLAADGETLGSLKNRFALIGDFDGSGKAAIAAVVSPALGQRLIHILQPDAQGQLSAVQVITPENSGQAQSLVVYDWDGDGRLDILATVISGGQPSLVLYPHTTAGAFGAGQLLLAGGGANLVADLNADGLPDLGSGSTVRIAEPGGTFAPPQSYYLPGSFVFPVRVADVNGDGRPDLVSAEDLTDNVSILLNR
jgi:hypothetical protein